MTWTYHHSFICPHLFLHFIFVTMLRCMYRMTNSWSALQIVLTIVARCFVWFVSLLPQPVSGDSKERASKPQKSLGLPRPGLHRYSRIRYFHQHCTKLCLTEDFLTSVYVKDVERLFEINDGGSLLLLVPIRLGGESLNPIYIPCVQVRRLALDRRVMLTNSTYVS